MSASAVIPSISIDGLLAARDAAHAAFAEARRLATAAREQLAAFEVTMPCLSVEFAGNDHRSLLDEEYAGAIRREVDRHVWKRVLEATNVDLLMDAKTRSQLRDRLGRSAIGYGAKESDLPELTRENIEATWKSTLASARDYFETAVDSVYRSLLWDRVTNTPGLIGERCIIRSRLYGYSVRYSEPLQDLERVLLVLDGQPSPTHQSGIRSMPDIVYGQWAEVPSPVRSVLSIKAHKCGTLHVRIHNQRHAQQMNAIVSRRYPHAIGTGDRRKKRA